jgi:predicted lysophospholipase L1 biosynthesis ABC-type transport system permease subunit
VHFCCVAQILCTSVFVILCLLVIPTRQRIHGAVLLPTVGANERETLPGGEREVGLQDDESALMVTLVSSLGGGDCCKGEGGIAREERGGVLSLTA